MKHTYRRRINAAALLALMISSTVAPVAWPQALTLSPTKANQQMITRLTVKGQNATNPQVSIFNDGKRAGAAAAVTVLAILVNHMAQAGANALMTADKKGLSRTKKQVAKDVALAMVSKRKLAQVGLGSLLAVFKKDATRDASSTVAKRLYAWFMANKVFTVLSFAEFVGAVYFIFFRENNEWARRSEWNELEAELNRLITNKDLGLDKENATLTQARANENELRARLEADEKNGITGTLAERKAKTEYFAKWREYWSALEIAENANYDAVKTAIDRWNTLHAAGCKGDKLSEKEASLLAQKAALEALTDKAKVTALASDEAAAQLAHALSLLEEKPALTKEVVTALNARQAAYAEAKAAEDAKFEAACAALVVDLETLTPAQLMKRYNEAKLNSLLRNVSIEFERLQNHVQAWQNSVLEQRQTNAKANNLKSGDLLKTVCRSDGTEVYIQVAEASESGKVTFTKVGGTSTDKDKINTQTDPAKFTFAPEISNDSELAAIEKALADLETLHEDTKAVTSYQARVAALTAQLEAKRKAADEALHREADVPPAADEDLPATKKVWVRDKKGEHNFTAMPVIKTGDSIEDVQNSSYFLETDGLRDDDGLLTFTLCYKNSKGKSINPHWINESAWDLVPTATA